jgi:hypothetical protein
VHFRLDCLVWKIWPTNCCVYATRPLSANAGLTTSSNATNNSVRELQKDTTTRGPSARTQTSLVAAVDQFTKGTMAVMHEVALLRSEVSSLRKANEALSKRRRAKKTRVQLGGSLTVRGAQSLLDQKAVGGEEVPETQPEGSGAGGPWTKVRCCGVCGKPGHNARTCQEAAGSSDSVISDVIIVGS